MQALLLKMSKRLIEVQQTTLDANIEQIIQANHLMDGAMEAGLDEKKSRQIVVQIAIALYQASSAKSDSVATKLMKEFQITYTPSPSKSPPAN